MCRSHQSRIGLTIDEIHLITGHLQTNQHRSDDLTSQQLDEHSRLLGSVLIGQSNLQGLLQIQKSSDPSIQLPASQLLTDTEKEPSNSVVRIQTYVPQHQQSPCTPCCRCTCHNVWAAQSPALLHEVIGTLFIGYSGYPI